jgi:hypothetical protein
MRKGLGEFCVSAVCLLIGLNVTCGQVAETPTSTIWASEVGQGFRQGAQALTIEAGANYGLASFGSEEAHHLALVSLSYGHVLGRVVGEGHWYRGNWEFRAELFGGAEFLPDNEYVIGLTPHLRYNFITGTRWVLFVDAGAGVSATSIGPPDLSNIFEFNLQAALGAHWFLKQDVALTVEVRFFHLSCAGISQPNQGLNGVLGLIGVTRFF